MNNKQLRAAIDNGKLVQPISGPTPPPRCRYEPRTKYDPQPWTCGTYRYKANELETVFRDPIDYQRWLKSSRADAGTPEPRSNHAGGVA